MIEWILGNLQLIIALIVSPLITWFFVNRHYQQRELKTKDLENDSSQSGVVAQNLDLYQRMLDDVESRYEIKLQKRDLEISFLEREIEELKARLKKLEKIR